MVNIELLKKFQVQNCNIFCRYYKTIMFVLNITSECVRRVKFNKRMNALEINQSQQDLYGRQEGS